MSGEQFFVMLQLLNRKLWNAQNIINKPMPERQEDATKGQVADGAALGIAGAVLGALGVGLTGGPLGLAWLGVGLTGAFTLKIKTYSMQRREAERFYQQEFLPTFEGFGVTVYTDDGCNLFTTNRLHFQVSDGSSDEQQWEDQSFPAYAAPERYAIHSAPTRESSLSALFRVPESIDQAAANELQASVRRRALALCDDDLRGYYPQVVLSYATGSREGRDGQGAGPGVIHVSALMHALFDADLPCYSGLTLPVGRNWEVFKMRLVKRGEPQAKVLVALLTPAFYNSLACLQEVSLAAEFGISVVSLRFEDELPGRRRQWPEADGEDMDLMVERAQRVLSGRNTIPPRGIFAQNLETNLDELRGVIRTMLLPRH